MKQQSLLAGAGAVAFGILAFLALVLASPPGGTYSVGDVNDFLAKGHRPAIFISVYLMLIATAGLVLFLAWLRDAVVGPDRAAIFWGFSIAAAAAWLAGFLFVISPAVALAFSGGHLKTLDPQTTYALNEGGYAIMYGAGGLLLGCALVTFAVGVVRVPAWFRWSTAVAGVCALAALAWFPFFLVYLWAIAAGLYTAVAERRQASQPAAVAA
jgi:hypothetical protein